MFVSFKFHLKIFMGLYLEYVMSDIYANNVLMVLGLLGDDRYWLNERQKI